jgi:glycosyltransferase involved in cell wall biosynthesis
LKIIQLIQKPQLRGAEVFACQLAGHLEAAGHAVKVLAIMRGTANLPFAGIEQLCRPPAARLWDVYGWKQLDKIIRGFQPDVIQANAGDTLKFAVFSKLFFGWKAPIVFRNANKVSDFIDSRPKLLFNRFLVSRVQRVVSVSETCRQDFLATYGFPAARSIMISSGLEFKPAGTGVPADLAPVFSSGCALVQVASLVPEKNPLGLLRIFARLFAHNQTLKLLMIGDGKLRNEVEQAITELGLGQSVFLLGYRTDVLDIVRHAAALLLPSRIEGLPGVILEAMYCKTPVVAYDVGGVSEVVKPGETGWLVKKDDEDGFVKAVGEVLAGVGVERIVARAHEMVVREYDNRAIAKRFEEVYWEVVRR